MRTPSSPMRGSELHTHSALRSILEAKAFAASSRLRPPLDGYASAFWRRVLVALYKAQAFEVQARGEGCRCTYHMLCLSFFCSS